MILERLTGLDGRPPTAPGLYFPFQVLDHTIYLDRLQVDAGKIVALSATQGRVAALDARCCWQELGCRFTCEPQAFYDKDVGVGLGEFRKMGGDGLSKITFLLSA